jgi:hypothetical protein
MLALERKLLVALKTELRWFYNRLLKMRSLGALAGEIGCLPLGSRAEVGVECKEIIAFRLEGSGVLVVKADKFGESIG